VTWRGKILPLVVLNESNQATYADIARAILYAADAGARIINISVGGTEPSDALQAAVDYAWALGCVVFAASMNNGDTAPVYPAACDHVVAVGASAYDDSRAEFSNYGSWIDLVAPGEGILTTSTGAAYLPWTGTSMATPIAAGVAALILSANPDFTAQELMDQLLGSCDDLGATGWDEEFGAGRVNAASALAGSTPVPPGEDPAQTATPPSATTASTASADAVDDDQSTLMRCASSTGSAGGLWIWILIAIYGSVAISTRGSSSRAISSSR
jgi:subtilisin family serine protease